MIEAAYQKYLTLTNCPSAAATLVLAEVVSGQSDQPELLTVKQAAKRLGIGIKKVYEMCAEGAIKHQRIGNRVRIKPTDLVLEDAPATNKRDRMKAVDDYLSKPRPPRSPSSARL